LNYTRATFKKDKWSG